MWTGLNSLVAGDVSLAGRTYLWMFPIYGLAFLLEPIHDRIRLWPPLARGSLWMVLFTGIEYLSGWLIRSITGSCPWDYSYARWNIDGLIRLDYLPLWFLAGFLYELVHR
ncbi:MAG TPA: hypothetical protein VHS59_01920, partial [Bacillota bacterium]|nr:hypothetical protein [Bacillota bacterium]